MQQYILKRLLIAVPSLLGVTIVVFLSIRIVPGDVLTVMLAEGGHLSTEQLALAKKELGIDKPLYEQYVVWMGNVVRGDLGNSYWSRKSVLSEIGRSWPVTLELGLLAVLISVIIAVPIGIISAVRQDTALDYGGRLLGLIGLSVPGFWLGTSLIVFPAIWWRWTPPIGYVSLNADLGRNLQQFFLPALALGAFMAGSLMRMTRSAMLEVLRQDYVTTARAKGLREIRLISRHALKNALIPVVTVLGLQVRIIIGGAIIIEQIFSLPGMGRLVLNSIAQRDYMQLQGTILVIAIAIVGLNLLVDLCYAWLDPRINFG